MLTERLADIRRDFSVMVELGAHNGVMREFYTGNTLIQTEHSYGWAEDLKRPAIVCDEEFLPFAESSLDAVISTLSLHTINDLPGTLIQIQRALKPDGLFLAILPGANTLKELRDSLSQAEMEREGGISPRIAPFLEVRDAGNLLQRAGFALPMADTDTLSLSYAHPYALLQDLRQMGETSILAERRKTPLRRTTLARAFELYQERHTDAEGRVTATVELVTLTGWKPHTTQSQPAKRGSGTMKLGEFLNS